MASEPATTKADAYGRYFLGQLRERVSDLRRELLVAEGRLLIAESQYVTGQIVTGFPKGESPIERLLEGPKQKAGMKP